MSFTELVQMSCSGGGGGAGQSNGGTGLADSAAGSMLIESCELGSLTPFTCEPNIYSLSIFSLRQYSVSPLVKETKPQESLYLVHLGT